MNAIILHGRSDKEDYYEPTFPSSSNAHWLPWLQKQLIVSDIAAQTPDVPLSYEPKYEIWCREFERQDIGPDTILVGHSCGGGFLVRWLSEHKDIKVASVVLVAPWLDPLNELKDDFFDFEIDSELADRTQKLVVLNSDDDEDTIHASVQKLKDEIKGLEVRELSGFGHFRYKDMHRFEFPELLKELINEN